MGRLKFGRRKAKGNRGYTMKSSPIHFEPTSMLVTLGLKGLGMWQQYKANKAAEKSKAWDTEARASQFRTPQTTSKIV